MLVTIGALRVKIFFPQKEILYIEQDQIKFHSFFIT